MITKSLPINPLAGRTAAAIMTLPNMGLLAGLAAMRGRTMIAGKETKEGIMKNQVDTATNQRLTFFSLSCERA